MLAEITSVNVPVKLWAPLEEVESAALTQLRNVASLPQVFHHVAAMADCHYGKGATVGSVIAMKNAVSPACVGVDQGCGMGAIKTSLTASGLPDNLEKLRADIESKIPVGFNMHETPAIKGKEGNPLKRSVNRLFSDFDKLDVYVGDLKHKALRQLGTLGGGNHFIEICLDTEQNVWLMLHSGSRNIGKELAEVHITRAKELTHNQRLVDPDLATFLGNTPEMAAYMHDLSWAQEYAFLNRRVMFQLFEEVMEKHFATILFEEPILCHHNYLSTEYHFGHEVILTRKGAISAKLGELGIIPGSMGSKSFIVRGKGNPESFHSASHGAGRRMSRGAAKRNFTVADLEQQTEGVCCRKDAGVLDEIPGAYKDIMKVMDNQKDLVDIVAELKQVLCIKG